MFPGGWSAHGQPCDQFHSMLRKEIRRRDLESCQMVPDLRARPKFSQVDMRASGQLVKAVKSWPEIIDLTLESWKALPRRIFVSAWLLCGYFDEQHFRDFVGADSVTLAEAQATLHEDFGEFGLKGTPQRCTAFEWQVQDDLTLPTILEVIVLYCFFTDTRHPCNKKTSKKNIMDVWCPHVLRIQVSSCVQPM